MEGQHGKVIFTKHDTEKRRHDLIPPEALEAYAEVLTIGAKKYGERNWEKGGAYSRILGALMRHTNAYRAGRPDSEGVDHLAAIMFCAGVLITWEARKIGVDDRANPAYELPTYDDRKLADRSLSEPRYRAHLQIQREYEASLIKHPNNPKSDLKVLMSEVGEVADATTEGDDRLKQELAQVAATAIRWMERLNS